jgi:pimeloyl-ACP methyl ester carboxylesterase
MATGIVTAAPAGPESDGSGRYARPMVTETDLELADGRRLHFYDAGPDDGGASLPVFWQHGTPNTGTPPEPLFAAAAANSLRWVSHDRPGYGGSTPNPGRVIGSVAADVAAIADALGFARFAVMGHSGGGAHALACAALLPGRVVAVVCGSGLAPFGAAGLDWYAGMYPGGAAGLRAASAGRAEITAELAKEEFDPEMFTPADHAALEGPWAWLGQVAMAAIEAGPAGQIDDELANVGLWGFDPARVATPVLFLHGEQDRIVPSSHSQWLARQCPSAQLRLMPGDGHVSVLSAGAQALEWLAAASRGS